ncbi:TlpA disulfide reductase family protein [Agreia sp. PsM10]|uniref:TlpA family protein disulfide reductase n=1 Tax=Agreia sp. PsM10 TaxID=3030533 RepID=UPI00263BA1C1|nr:TlpA disulfide reductase family protein [Agreia sp. PsM10]MDN4641730.1 TlpA disulfide reductase family protein [Agreia sp. PsM10]
MTGIRMRRATRVGLAGLVVAGTVLLAGCANDPLADQYLSGDSKNYIAGDGTVTEIEPDSRQQPVDFAGTTAEGTSVSQADYAGEVVVLNFWYASCAPCRVEAPELAKLSEKYDGEGASFLGVNVRDQAPQAISFEENYGIDYPSVIDTDGALQLAFSGDVSPNAVPTTLVIDKQGRVAARILGQVSEPSILDTLIRDTIAESS